MNVQKERYICIAYTETINIAKFGKPMIFIFKAANELTAYVHEPGYELWFIHGYYPEALKPMTIVKHEEGVTDFAIQKSIHDKAENCDDDSDYSQYQCLKEEYRRGFEKLGIDCISPWSHSILDLKTYKNHSCTERELEADFQFGANFFITASENKLNTCRGTLRQINIRTIAIFDPVF